MLFWESVQRKFLIIASEFDGINWTYFNAETTASAETVIDYEFFPVCKNRVFRTDICATSARHTVIINFKFFPHDVIITYNQ